jgi:hypothetical protein
MSLAIILIPVGVAGLCAASEYFMARHSKWDVLSRKFRNASVPSNGWRGCKFAQMEIVQGNTLKRTTYGHGYSRSGLDLAWAHLFPKVLVSVGPAGLYLKRQPWNFLHHQILIPWGRFNSIQTISVNQHATGSASRQFGFAADHFRAKMPDVVSGVIDKLAGDVLELRLSDPNVRIDLPADAVANWEKFVAAKPKAPVRQPSSPVGVA